MSSRLDRFFARAGLSWTVGQHHENTVIRNDSAVPENWRGDIPAQYCLEALYLQNVDDAAAWYRPCESAAIDISLSDANNSVSDCEDTEAGSENSALEIVGAKSMVYQGGPSGSSVMDLTKMDLEENAATETTTHGENGSCNDQLLLGRADLPDLAECPIAFARIEEGCLGYVGDMDGAQGSHHVVLAMCGVY